MSLTRRSRSLRSSPHPPPRHRYRLRPYPQYRWRPSVLDALPRLPSVCCIGRLFCSLCLYCLCVARWRTSLWNMNSLGKSAFLVGLVAGGVEEDRTSRSVSRGEAEALCRSRQNGRLQPLDTVREAHVPLSCAEDAQRGITAPFLYAWH